MNLIDSVQHINFSGKSASKRSIGFNSIVIVTGALIVAFSISCFSQPLAKGKDKYLGNVLTTTLYSNFPDYWNQVTPGNAGKWGSVEGTQGSYYWIPLDNIYNFAVKNSLVYKHHNFVWGSQQPSWITSVDSATQRTEVENWIKAVCARYPKIDQIDVVNEPLHAAPSYKNALGGNGKTGWDWVVTSFQLARKYANPTTKLLINDYSILQSNSETDSYIAIIDTLKSRGLIDGIGIQGHYFEFRSETGTTPSYAYSISTLQSNLNRITALGLPLYISEFDINESVDSLQLQYYKTYFPMFWENPVVKGMTLWGYVEYDMWKADAFLIDDRYVERPAMKWLRNYLQTPFKPVLVSPVSAVNVIRNPVLIWNASAAADSYHVQLSTNSTFATVIVDTTVTDTTLNLGLLDANARYYWRASSINSYGESDFSAGVAFLTGTALGVNDRKPIALDFKLSQNYPNPFNPTTMISFTLPQRSNIHLTLVDMLGREVKEIASGEFEAGIHTVQLNASGLASGVYIYRLNAGNYGSAKKLIVTK